MYVAKLRTKNMQYKKSRTSLAGMRSEHGVLNRTEMILSKLQDQTNRRLVAAENKKGVAGKYALKMHGGTRMSVCTWLTEKKWLRST